MKSREGRLRKLEEAADPYTALMQKSGLCALLEATRWLEHQGLWDEHALDDDLPPTGFGALLREARQWQQEREA